MAKGFLVPKSAIVWRKFFLSLLLIILGGSILFVSFIDFNKKPLQSIPVVLESKPIEQVKLEKIYLERPRVINGELITTRVPINVPYEEGVSKEELTEKYEKMIKDGDITFLQIEEFDKTQRVAVEQKVSNGVVEATNNVKIVVEMIYDILQKFIGLAMSAGGVVLMIIEIKKKKTKTT